MKAIYRIMGLVIAVLLFFTLPIPKSSVGVEGLGLAQEDPENYIFLDVTYDPKAQTYSLGGFSVEQLKQLGLPGLQPEIWNVLGGFDSMKLELDETALKMMTDDEELATINWDQGSRQLVYDLIDSYGNQNASVNDERLESWLGKAKIVLNVRNSPEISSPLVIDLDTLLKVDVNNEGKVAIEGFDTGMALQPEITGLVDVGKISNASLCWSKGVLHLSINGANLPVVTLHEGGMEVVDKALGLNLGTYAPYFGSQLGASISFYGSQHEFVDCADLD